MTRDETAELSILRADFDDFRAEVREQWAAMGPVIALYTTLDRLVDGVARFVKWGFGVGASVVTIAVGLKALGIV